MLLKPTPLALHCARAGVLTLIAGTALAQSPQTQERIEVTGSNIKRTSVEGPAPVQVMTREEIASNAKNTVGELLRDITANSGGSSAENAINSQSGAAGISLRGLGQKSTLVLINGRRMANHAFAQGGQDTFVDLNSIPKSAVQRIEVLKDGASAIYGSDAIAGVVNIILRRDFKGVEIGGSVGSASQGGLDESGLNLAVGTQIGGLNLMGVVDLFNRDMLTLDQRPWLNQLDFRFLPGGTYFPASSGGTWVRPVGVTTGLSRTPIPNCIAPSMVMPGNIVSPVITGNVCGYPVDKYLTAFPKAGRMGIFTRASYTISPSLDAFAELSYSDNQSDWINQPQTMTNTSVSFNPATGGFSAFSNVIPSIPAHAAVNATNPYGRPASLNYTFFDVGARTFDLNTKAHRALVGLNGNWGAWDWSAAIGTAESKIRETTGNQVDALVLRRFIDQGGYDFLAPTSAQTAALRISTTRNSVSRLRFADIKISGELMKLAAGPVGFAAGLDLRSESMNDVPDPIAQQGRLIGTGSSRTSGERDARAVHVEFNVPIFKGLEAQIAGRSDSYSDFGSAFSPKLGAKWVINPQVAIRASSSKGFRAPTLVENSNSSSLGFGSVLDPERNNASTIIGILNTGSRNLKAETSTSTSWGVVLEPMDNLSVALDVYRIEQRDVVNLSGAQFIVRNPTLFPGKIVRDAATNQILVVFDNYTNQALINTRGVDLDLRAKLPANRFGKFTARTSLTMLRDWTYQGKAGDPVVNYANRNDGPSGTLPLYKVRASLDWAAPNFAMTFTANQTGGYDQRNTTAAAADKRVADLTTLDVYAAYTGIKSAKVGLSITNLFNKNPPWDIATGVGISNSQYDLRGRYLRAFAEYKF